MKARAIFALVGLLYSSFSIAQQGEQCNLLPITRQLSAAKPANGLPFGLEAIELTFSERTISRTGEDGTVFTNDVIIPSLRLRAPVTGIIEKAKREARQEILEKKPKDIDIRGIEFGNPVINSQRVITLPGSFVAEKWWKMDGFCCRWFSCRRCEWKTRVFERTVKFTAVLGNTAIASTVVPSVPAAASEPHSSTGSQHTAASLVLSASGQTKDDRNDLEKVWDAVGGFLEAVGTIFNGHDNLQLKDFLQETYSLDDQSIEAPNVANRRLDAYGYDTNLVSTKRVRTYESRDAWEAFNAGLFFSTDRTGFFAEPSGNQILMIYDFDYDRYSEVLNSSALAYRASSSKSKKRSAGASLQSGGFVFDILDKSLCGLTRKSFEDYIESLGKKFEGEDDRSEQIQASSRIDLTDKLREKYVVGGAEELFRSMKRTGQTNAAERKLVVSAPSATSLMHDRWTVPAQGSLWAISKQNDWSPSEYKCAERIARKRSGSASRIYPLQSFAECANLTSEQIHLERLFGLIEEKYGAEVFTPFRVSGAPISGDVFYRGWYYCYKNPSICAGAQRVTWWTDPSMYGARGGSHNGLDLMHGAPNESIPLIAAVDGQIIYNNADPNGWGHALIIPFEKDTEKYMAVYAHLPPSAKAMDGKKVKVGDSLGFAGCSGNAGDGNGKCNNYCSVSSASRASDIHLHFGVLKKSPTGASPVDPLSILPFAIKTGPPRRLYVCQGEAYAAISAAGTEKLR